MDATLADVKIMGELMAAVEAGHRIHMERDGCEFTGVLRAFTEGQGPGFALWNGGDFRDKWVHVSSTFEHWFKVSELVDGLKSGTIFIRRGR
ncbi:hypothetical protein SEA_SLIMJIMMY_140 [Mycobacterium phage SlimJimmy]|uniref:Uncharacterized protein n=3 Tax=Bongovirus bongo TaxID=1983750 RepID=A0A0M5M0U7_9CAUD|nr:hypothetical protein SEA_BRICOLE_144 [Mycobacterium phage Bricole]AXQ52762.1 hypothetical protein SEA_IPHANE7_140 [Mycobacterium phage IPhane7]QGJ93264.1 hypothetical protein SEA_TYDAWG_136 [Mycobacterium phage TyDawg]WMI33301.1 hypothetical protein SEA_SLIMJIMMY_140 [Mycobacterium phage SlimJimmy]WNM75333.1 hypothetical protein SEA_AUSPICE_143 [Mycobacterium phage Auspice]